MKFSSLLASSAALAVIGVLHGPIQGNAQLVLPDVVPGDVIQGIKGTTITRSAQSGSRSSVNFGSNTTFGTSSTINSTAGSYAASEAFLAIDQNGSGDCASGGCISSSVGGTDGLVNADLANIRSAERTATETSSTSNGTSTGQVDLSGIKASNALTIDGNASSFSAQTHTIHATNQPGNENIFANNPNVANVEGENQNATATSNTSINTLTNVDISTTEFVSSFQQAY